MGNQTGYRPVAKGSPQTMSEDTSILDKPFDLGGDDELDASTADALYSATMST